MYVVFENKVIDWFEYFVPEFDNAVSATVTKTVLSQWIAEGMAWPLNQDPVSDLRYNKFPSSDQC